MTNCYMENLIKCSKILYNKDIADKNREILYLQNEIRNLKKEYSALLSPRIFFNNHKEWHKIVSDTLSYIYNYVSRIHLYNDNFGNNVIVEPGRWLISDRHIKYEMLKQSLIRLGGSEPWADKVSKDIISDLNNILNQLKLHERYSYTEIRKFVYFFIHDKLCERHSNSILANIPQYKCTKCHQIYNDPYDSEDDGEIFKIFEICEQCYNS